MESDDGIPAMPAGELPRRRSRGELLEHIYAEGERRRRRRRVSGIALASAALAVVAGLVMTVTLPGGTSQHVATGGQAVPALQPTTTSVPALLPSTTVDGEPEIVVPPTTSPRPAQAPTTVNRAAGGNLPLPTTTTRPIDPEPDPGPTSTTQPPSTLATSRCVNGTDPACGPFHWQPDPGPNAPLVIEVTATPRADAPRTFDFTIVYRDADAPIVDGCRGVDFGDGESTFTGSTRSCAVAACIVPYGPWTPPSPQAGRADATLSHTFARAGTFEVTLSAISRHSLCHDPYASSATKTITVVVP